MWMSEESKTNYQPQLVDYDICGHYMYFCLKPIITLLFCNSWTKPLAFVLSMRVPTHTVNPPRVHLFLSVYDKGP